MQVNLNHDIENKRFVADIEGQDCYVDYKKANGNILDLTYTYVPESLRNKGIGSSVVEETLKFVKAHNYKVKPSCSFIENYIHEHQEHKKLLAINQ